MKWVNTRKAETDHRHKKLTMMAFCLTKMMEKTEYNPRNNKMRITTKIKSSQTRTKAKTESRLVLRNQVTNKECPKNRTQKLASLTVPTR